jgi:FlaA1/EpsC-like NDP-sugar epimerase
VSLPAAEIFSGRRVLITGAAGSIGGALARAIAAAGPEALVLLDASEQGVYELDRDFSTRAWKPVVRLGSVLERDLLAGLFQRHRPEIVFHAAAFKHVPLLEREPFAAIHNNVFGTAAVLEQALAHGSRQLILVSTDKAADPASIMGASKPIPTRGVT